MINFTDMTGLASSATAMASAALLLPGVARMPKSGLALLVSAVAMASIIPFAGLPAAAYVRGAIGDLSITSLVLLMLAILRPLFGWRSSASKDSFALQILITIAALGLYPLALGLGYFDPYRLGYGNLWFLSVLLVVALAACFRGLPVVALCIALAVLAWDIGWYESNNLWDYLLDPLLSIYAVSAVMRHSVQTLLK
ncbi:MAG: hypothetical protein KGL01_06970 [Betaproteobacteria bacterium]|nr:hypothetical protein [Betaproteobacteria bacterium]